MNNLEMIRFGKTLTDREYGKKISQIILEKESFPMTLDFKGVISLGSSCGDEILNTIGPKQENNISVLNANAPIKACLSRVAEDLKIKITIL
ncbi:MAG: hypothetical protein KA715_02395 [Xanthomonadaceae bacterium]|nr:hypothetical protein [Xanthomonadaceae bacterium]